MYATAYLARFADEEGSAFLRGFYEKYYGQGEDQTLETLVAGNTPYLAAVVGHLQIRPAARRR